MRGTQTDDGSSLGIGVGARLKTQAYGTIHDRSVPLYYCRLRNSARSLRRDPRCVSAADRDRCAAAYQCMRIHGIQTVPRRSNPQCKGEYDDGTIIRIQADKIGDNYVDQAFNEVMTEFCRKAGYADFNQAN